MFSRVFKIISISLIAILAVFLQFSFISSLPLFFRPINLPLAALLISLIFFGPKESYISALFFGFVLDSLYFSPFGTYLLSFFLIVLIAQTLLNNWFSNRSLYSFLILALIVSFIFNVLWSTFNFIFTFGGGGDGLFILSWHYLKNLFFSAGWLVFISGTIFLALSLFSNRLKPVFLRK